MKLTSPLSAIGWKAHRALARTGGRVCLLAPLSESIYFTAGEDIVWLGRTGASLHPRALLTAMALPAPVDVLTIDVGTLRPWRPVTAPAAASATVVTASARALLVELRHTSSRVPPLGLGRLLVGEAPPFPLGAAVSRAVALARACEANDASAAGAAAVPLLGLGPGLTPSGDDFVGGAFFARRALAGGRDDPGWERAAATVVERARALTHPISAALLSDLVAGDGHEPLHDLAAALAAGAPTSLALDTAHRLSRIGHSSGWDMLAGLLAGILGAAVFVFPTWGA